MMLFSQFACAISGNHALAISVVLLLVIIGTCTMCLLSDANIKREVYVLKENSILRQ